MKLGSILTTHALAREDHIALICDGKRFTFYQFNCRVNMLANALLSRGITAGDKVACITPNCVELLDVYWAVAKIGAAAVPISPLLRGEAIQHLIEHSESKLAFVSADALKKLGNSDPARTGVPRCEYIQLDCSEGERPSYQSLVADSSIKEPPVPHIDASSPVMIVYSSGTTGDPKGIVLSHYARAMYCLLYASSWRMTPECVTLHTGSVVFNGAFMTLLPSFYVGGTYILHRSFCPTTMVETIERENVTHCMLVPTQIKALLSCEDFTAERLRSLTALISIGAPLRLEDKRRLYKIIGDKFYEFYGVAEGFATILDKTHAKTKLASVGIPQPFFEMKIVGEHGQVLPMGEIGEIAGSGPIVMNEYYKRPDLTKQTLVEGWIHTGDLGYVDEDGFLYIAGRKKELIKSGGVSVYPQDIEDVVAQHPAVRNVVVFGIPDERWGEVPIAAVILNDKAERCNIGTKLKDWINENVAATFQRVSDVYVIDEFPVNTAGKILKRSIRERYLESVVHIGN